MFYYQNTLLMPTSNAELTRRLYSVHAVRPQRAHGALDEPTSVPQRCHSVLKTTTDAWRSRRLHSVSTALLSFAQRATRRSAFCKRYENTVRTPLWCDRGLRDLVQILSRKLYLKRVLLHMP